MRKVFQKILFGILIVLLIMSGYLFIGKPSRAEKIIWGVNFSQKHAQNLGLDWRETYLALLDDLEVKHLKVAAHWDLIEPEKDKYRFNDLDWQFREAEKRGAKILLVIGIRTPRWPECHIPDWAKNLSKEEQQKEILKMLKKTVLNYRHSPSIDMWQVENEPFFPFGECPWADAKFLKEEINLVKSLDPSRPVVISDSGEGSFWLRAAEAGDIVGTTMYKKVWFSQLNFYVYYPFNPTFYWRKAKAIEKIFDKNVICVELQAEPWCPVLLYDCPIQEQEKTMNLDRFKANIEFAQKTGLDQFYLWGGEWWYWLKIEQDSPEIWNEAKKLFSPF